MAVKVVDASAAAALVYAEAEEVEIAERLRGVRLVAPVLLPFEMASICLKKMRRDPASGGALLDAFDRFRRLQIASLEVDHAAVIELANRAGLSSYDASYLWLARQLGAELVTLDARLEAAATLS
jgi:predicted nucleic acid-binding protein